MTDFNILISSGGRRTYLVRWFQEALVMNDVSGRVVLADCDPHSPATALADDYVCPPRVSAPDYDEWLAQGLQSARISLGISVNDFELSRWSLLPAGSAPQLIRLAPDAHQVLEDKLTAHQVLQDSGVLSPLTILASDALKVRPTDLTWLLDTDEFVVKGRFGSGSRGLRFARAAGVADAVASARAEVTDRDGTRPLDPGDLDDLIVVQPRIQGQEYGVDVINDFDGEYVAALPRKKLAMRDGETDHAETVPASGFASLASDVGHITRHRGLIDLDVIRDAEGRDWVIDVNPRFGGGYPFSHAAGAHVPAAYVAWALGRKPLPEWVESVPGVVGAKAINVQRLTDRVAERQVQNHA